MGSHYCLRRCSRADNFQRLCSCPGRIPRRRNSKVNRVTARSLGLRERFPGGKIAYVTNRILIAEIRVPSFTLDPYLPRSANYHVVSSPSNNDRDFFSSIPKNPLDSFIRHSNLSTSPFPSKRLPGTPTPAHKEGYPCHRQ